MKTPQTQTIENPEHNNFHIMLNMADDDLNPYEYRLLGHYRRVCGENGKTCKESTKETADVCQMSAGMVSKTRKSLAEKGWLRLKTIEIPGSNLTALHVELVDRWRENIDRYSDVRTGSSHEPITPHEPPAEDSGSPHERATGDSGSPGEPPLRTIYKEQEPKNHLAESPNGDPPVRTTPPKRKRRNPDPVPASVINPMKDAIAKAFGWSWDGEEPMADEEKGLIQKTARSLCRANVKPEQIPSLFGWCKKNLEFFGPMALATNVSKWRQDRRVIAVHVNDGNPLKDAHLRARKDCPHCGGNGIIMGSTGASLACVCLKEADHAIA